MRDGRIITSYNHCGDAAIVEWIYRYAAGIDVIHLDAAFHTGYLHPTCDRKVDDLYFRFQSPYREIHSSCRVAGDKAHWPGRIPWSATGWLHATRTEARDTS